MRIDALHAYQVTLPFRIAFANASAQGRSSEIVVVEVITGHKDIIGYGEGLPVKAVTGETPEQVMVRLGTLSRSPAFPWQIDDIAQIWRFVDQLPPTKFDNTAICALEMALLDAWGKEVNRPLVDLLPQANRTDRIYYGAPITLGDRQTKETACRAIHAFGIQHVRAKMESRYDRNKETLETFSEVFEGAGVLGIDPNGAWNHAIATRHLPLIRQHRVRVVEEPFCNKDPGFKDFAQQLRTSGVSLMACESAPTLAEIKQIIRNGSYDRVNVKLCRSGGFRRTLKMIAHLRKKGLAFQLGCSTGESGILSAAGRALSLLNRDAVTHDGSYDTFLLDTNTTSTDVTFGPGGEAGPLPEPGLGVQIDKMKLERLCCQRKVSIKRND